MTQSLPSANSADVRSPEKTGRRLTKYGGFAALVLVGVAAGFGLTYLVQPSGIGSATGITALLTVAAALLGVVLTNQHNANRQSREIQANEASQRSQLSHDRDLADQSMTADRELKKIEREMSFRKEIYTNAAGAIITNSQTLGRFLDASANRSELIKQFHAQSVHIGKIHLVASNETLKLAIAYSAQMIQELYCMSQLHESLATQAATIKSLQEHLAWVKKVKIDDEVNALSNAEHSVIPAVWSENVQKTEHELAALKAKEGKLQQDALIESFSVARRLDSHSIPLVTRIRHELGDTQFDGAKYKEDSESATNAMTVWVSQELGVSVNAEPKVMAPHSALRSEIEKVASLTVE